MEGFGENVSGKRRYVYMDVLRMIACLCVIYNHVYEYGYVMYAVREVGSAQYWVELFASMLCKLAVPTFFALSGALLLDREISLKKLWLERIARIALVLVLFSALYYGIDVQKGLAEPGIKTFIFGLYESVWGYPLWYLYAYLAYLVALPVLSRLAKALDQRTWLYLFAVALMYRCAIPGLEALRWENMHRMNPDFNLSFLSCDVVLYPMMGYYLHNRVDRNALKRMAPALCAAAVLLTATACFMKYREYFKTWHPQDESYHYLFAPVLCAAVFSTGRLLFEGIDEHSRLGRVLTEIGQCTFGIYLVHLLATEQLKGLWGWFDFRSATGALPLVGSLLYCVTMMLICLVPVWLLRKIPAVRKLIS